MKQNLYFRKNHIYVAKGSKIDFRTKIGKHTRINHASHIDYCEIGSYCAIAGRLIVRSQDHFTCYLNMQADFQKNILQSEISVTGKSDSKVKIGNAVWIGDSVIILKNVSIGNGAVIGAGSVVTKPIPAYAIAAGNPAKVLKFRFSTEICQIIESTKWWLWDIPKIIENRELFELDLTKENIEATKDFFKDIGRN